MYDSNVINKIYEDVQKDCDLKRTSAVFKISVDLYRKYIDSINAHLDNNKGNALSKVNENKTFIKLFDKKLDKSFINTGLTIPVKVVDKIEMILGVHVELGRSVEVNVQFNGNIYPARFCHVDIASQRRDCHQIYWKKSLSEALKSRFLYGDLEYQPLAAVEIGIDKISKAVVISD